MTPVTVRARRQRFAEDGLAGLEKIRKVGAASPRFPRRRSPRSCG